MKINSLPALYTFRRCPYAMRARLALWNSQIKVEVREILLKDKPASMLDYSPKGTVPVLVLSDERVIDESRDIIFWALNENDPSHWLRPDKTEEIQGLLDENDGPFKKHLDQYKYAVRHPEESMEESRKRGEVFLAKLEERLMKNSYLLDDQISVADIAIFPFIRQFAHVDKDWFEQAPYPKLHVWLESFLQSSLFLEIMKKYPLYQDEL